MALMIQTMTVEIRLTVIKDMGEVTSQENVGTKITESYG